VLREDERLGTHAATDLQDSGTCRIAGAGMKQLGEGLVAEPAALAGRIPMDVLDGNRRAVGGLLSRSATPGLSAFATGTSTSTGSPTAPSDRLTIL
jgi:hypothetical protein